MKRNLQRMMVWAVAAALAVGMQTAVFAADTTPVVATSTATSTISVNGQGEVLVKPDLAMVSLEVEHTASTAAEAQQKVTDGVTSILAAMQKLQIPEEDIVTSYVSVSPVYRYDDNGTRTQNGYRAYTSLQVRTNDVDHVGTVLDTGLQAGATGTSGVSFTLENPSVYYGQALREAIRTAESSAQTIANAYGKSLGDVIAVTEQSSNTSSVDKYYAEASTMNAMREDATSAGGGGSSSKIAYEDISVYASVEVVYGF